MHLKFSRRRKLHSYLSPTMVQTLQTKILFYFHGKTMIIYFSGSWDNSHHLQEHQLPN